MIPRTNNYAPPRPWNQIHWIQIRNSALQPTHRQVRCLLPQHLLQALSWTEQLRRKQAWTLTKMEVTKDTVSAHHPHSYTSSTRKSCTSYLLAHRKSAKAVQRENCGDSVLAPFTSNATCDLSHFITNETGDPAPAVVVVVVVAAAAAVIAVVRSSGLRCCYHN